MARKTTLATLQMTSWSVLMVIALILLLLVANFWLKVDSQDQSSDPAATENTSATWPDDATAADLNARLGELAAFGPRPEDTALHTPHIAQAEPAHTPLTTASR